MFLSARGLSDCTAPPPIKRVQMFVNPRAGGWRHRRIDALRIAFEDAGAAVIITPSLHGPLTIADGVDHVCAVGGDGTIRFVAAAVTRADPPPSISVYPLGTVNLLARECGYATDARAFVRRALARPARRHWLAQVDDMPMLTCASVGPDSWTVNSVSPRLKRLIGRGAYVVAFFAMLTRWRRQRLTLVADGQSLDCEAVYIAKGRYFAGAWSFAPDAALGDPLLHVVALPSCTRRAFARFAWSVLRGHDMHGAIRLSCSTLSITGDPMTPVQADGDVVATLPVEIRIAAPSLSFS